MKPYSSNTLTQQIRVQTKSFYVPERSNPAENDFFFAYRIRITNEGTDAAQLISRHWLIEDALGRVEEVRGVGVVGQQPRLEPGENYVYTSACPLSTEWGYMQGCYHMLRDDGVAFEAQIGKFLLLCAPLKN